MKYIAKKDTWFEEGTEVTPIEYDHKDPFPIGIFEGWRICENPIRELHALGERYRDQEDCNIDEFNIIDEDESQ